MQSLCYGIDIENIVTKNYSKLYRIFCIDIFIIQQYDYRMEEKNVYCEGRQSALCLNRN